jgi:hypothetical protein
MAAEDFARLPGHTSKTIPTRPMSIVRIILLPEATLLYPPKRLNASDARHRIENIMDIGYRRRGKELWLLLSGDLFYMDIPNPPILEKRRNQCRNRSEARLPRRDAKWPAHAVYGAPTA